MDAARISLLYFGSLKWAVVVVRRLDVRAVEHEVDEVVRTQNVLLRSQG